MSTQLVRHYTDEGLSRLSKEKLVKIISTLKDMPAEVAMKVSEHIPSFFDTCHEALLSTDSFYRDAIQQNEEHAQIQLGILYQEIESYTLVLPNAKTKEENEKVQERIKDLKREISDIKAQTLKERNDMIKDRGKFYISVLCLMAATLGVTINLGKKFN